MKKLMAVLALSSTMVVTDADAAKCDVDFGHDQLVTMQRAFDYGKSFGFEYSLAAITWQESSAGRKLVGGIENAILKNSHLWVAYGPYHALLKTAVSREQCSNAECHKEVIQGLMTDFDYASKHAVAELTFWQKRHGSDWMKIWGGYYGGYTNSESSVTYALELRDKIRYLKSCLNLK